ncbi:unnamed protein product [Symbiodinium natans]|uniref:Uncharacterized protein n=1 Tax=Symbiodinium natans TaxID=878477 RepID=A0A812NNR9_9DINO|nr:unnamed protein product [Symbiodinium natans]
MVQAKLCACIAYCIRLANRSGNDSAAQCLWKVLHDLRPANECRPHAVKISLFDALSFGRTVDAENQAVDVATQTLDRTYSEAECKHWAETLVAHAMTEFKAATGDLVKRIQALQDENLKMLNLNGRVDMLDEALSVTCRKQVPWTRLQHPMEVSRSSHHPSSCEPPWPAASDRSTEAARAPAVVPEKTLQEMKDAEHCRKRALKAERRRQRQATEVQMDSSI